jgi:hypothetical protein
VEGQPSAGQYLASGFAKPVIGVVGGAVTGVAAVVSGAATTVVGGVGGAYMNVRDGGSEIYESSRRPYSNGSTALPSTNIPQQFIKNDNETSVKAEIGKELWNHGVN